MSSQPQGERRLSSIDVLQERVEGVRSTVDRNHGELRSLIVEGVSDLKAGLIEVRDRVSAVEQKQAEQGVRLGALEQFRIQQEEMSQQRAMAVATAAERAEKAERRADMLDLLGKVLAGALAGMAALVTILAVLGVIG